MEKELQKIPYLKAVTQDMTFEGYVIPKKGSINFMISHMNWNPKIWEDPMEFKPERFLNSKGNNGDDQEVFDFDITGSRDPMEFKPEMFLNSKGNNGDDQEVFDFDITGSTEIKAIMEMISKGNNSKGNNGDDQQRQ